MNVQVLTVSSKGQISIPVEIRKLLNIGYADRLVAYTTEEGIFMKKLEIPKEKEFESLMNEAINWASSVGYMENDVNDIIKDVRKKKTSCE